NWATSVKVWSSPPLLIAFTVSSDPISSHDGSLRHAGWPGGKSPINSANVTAPSNFTSQMVPRPGPTGGLALKVAGSHWSTTSTLLSALAIAAVSAQAPHSTATILALLRMMSLHVMEMRQPSVQPCVLCRRGQGTGQCAQRRFFPTAIGEE